MKKVAILGSTGSIGIQTLSVIEKNRERFEVYALAAKTNVKILYQQIKRFSPEKVVLFDEKSADELRSILKAKSKPEILSGNEGLLEISGDKNVDILIVAVTGISGLMSVINGLRTGMRVALANKESLVTGGRFVVQEMMRSKNQIIPVDSEHSAIFQLLSGVDKDGVSKLILTATGGPFRGMKYFQIVNAQIKEVLKHPRWKMGRKVTIDSATMVNKAFEMIEARWLFGFGSEDIKVVIHPQALVHSLIQMKDGSFIAHIGPTDMRIPIGYALSYPDRLANILKTTQLSELEDITFEGVKPPFDRPLKIAKKIIENNSDSGIVFNAADEVAVENFLEGKIRFGDIIRIIDYSLKHIKPYGIKRIMDVFMFDMDVKKYIQKKIDKGF